MKKNPPQQLLSKLLEHYQNRRFSDAEKLALSITQEFPQTSVWMESTWCCTQTNWQNK